MSDKKFVDLFFQKKYIDWEEYLQKIGELEEEYYGQENFDRKYICG